MTRPSYTEAYEVISLYAPDQQVSFADGWSRFPGHPVAERIATKLDEAANWWAKNHADIAQRILAVSAEIRLRADS